MEYRFPLFVDLTHRKAVVVGGGKIAFHRAVILSEFGADVTLIAPECIAEVPLEMTYLHRAYQPGDLQGAFLAVAATDNREVNKQVGKDAVSAGVLVSVADRREESTFFFPAICKGSGLIAGVVSKGAEHKKTARAAKAIRTVLEDIE